MVRAIEENELEILKEDPVRPHLEKIGSGKQVFVLDDLSAVICVCHCKEVPTSEEELELFKLEDSPCIGVCKLDENDICLGCGRTMDDIRERFTTGSIPVAYTVWSNKPGAGRTIVNELQALVKESYSIKRLVTLSPLTEMATKFHIRNGAKLINKSETCQNFEYSLD